MFLLAQPGACHWLHVFGCQSWVVGQGCSWGMGCPWAKITPGHQLSRHHVGLWHHHSLWLLVVTDLHEQPHPSVTEMLKLAKQMTFQKKFLIGDISPDLNNMVWYGILCHITKKKKKIKQDGKTLDVTFFPSFFLQELS